MTDEITSTPSASSPSIPLGKSTSPEDLLKMYDEEPIEEAAEIEAEVEKQAKIAEEVPKQIAINKVFKKLDEAAAKIEESQTEEPQEDVVPTEKKSIKAKIDDQDLDIPEEALITQTLPNGKEISFKVTEAVQAMLQQEDFNRTMDSRTSKVAQRERIMEAQASEVVTKARSIASMAAQGDIVPAITLLAKMAAGNTGLDPIEYEKKFWGALEASKTLFTKMTPEQREVYFANRKAEELEKTIQERDREANRAKIEQQSWGELQKIEQKYGVSPEEILSVYKVLQENVVGPGKRFASAEDILPKDIDHYLASRTHVENLEKAIDKVTQEIGLDKIDLKDPDLFQTLFNETFGNEVFSTVEALEEALLKHYGSQSQKVENLKRKVEKVKTKDFQAQFKQGSSTKKVESVPEGYDSEEDVNFLYRNSR